MALETRYAIIISSPKEYFSPPTSLAGISSSDKDSLLYSDLSGRASFHVARSYLSFLSQPIFNLHS